MEFFKTRYINTLKGNSNLRAANQDLIRYTDVSILFLKN